MDNDSNKDTNETQKLQTPPQNQDLQPPDPPKPLKVSGISESSESDLSDTLKSNRADNDCEIIVSDFPDSEPQSPLSRTIHPFSREASIRMSKKISSNSTADKRKVMKDSDQWIRELEMTIFCRSYLFDSLRTSEIVRNLKDLKRFRWRRTIFLLSFSLGLEDAYKLGVLDAFFMLFILFSG